MNAANIPARVASEELIRDLVDARGIELELLEGIPDSGMFGTKKHFIEPPIWEMGHVGWFQERWILRHLDQAESILPGSDGIYDSFNVSYKLRWDHAFPSRTETCDYITKVLNRCIGRLERREPTPDDVYFYTLVTHHEDMHTENLILILQTLGYPRPALSLVDQVRGELPVNPEYMPRDVVIPGGIFLLGASPEESFVFDNEKWAHPVEVKPFRISSTTVTNAEFAAFVEDGGYRRREAWSTRGWDWRRGQQGD